MIESHTHTHTRCCRVPERVTEDLFARNKRFIAARCLEKKTQLDEMRPRQKSKGANKMICKSVNCRCVIVSDASVGRCAKDEKIYIYFSAWLLA